MPIAKKGVPNRIHFLYLFKLTQLPPLYTAANPFDFKMLLAEALRMPDAQQVIIGLSFFNFEILLSNVLSGILTEPFT
jgi:hypothetical protein